jgi:metal-responsive CopG/Arc/MetJ family transcriptional regulator
MTSGDKIVRLTVRLKEPIDQKLSEACEQMGGVSKNAFILMALSEKLKERSNSERGDKHE